MTETSNLNQVTADRKRVVVLGGGPAGLAAAHGLSRTPELRERYDVVVYQVGWRAGGKAASGRQGRENRIDQNGTHYLFGCYDNSFALVREAYDELRQAGDSSFGSYEEAFRPISTLALEQFFQGAWHDWLIEIPTNRAIPGKDTADLEPWDYLTMSLSWLVEFVGGWRLARAVQPRAFGSRDQPEWWDQILAPIERQFSDATNFAGTHLLRLALGLARQIGGEGRRELESTEALVWLLREARRVIRRLLGGRVEDDLEAQRQWCLVDLGCSMLIGMIDSEAFAPGGLAALDRYDYRDWLRRNGASETTLWSPLVRGWYDSVAAYECGDVERPSISTGVTIKALLSAGLNYKGAFAYQPTREVGDSVIGPIFEMLRRRGVRFRFFQRVRELVTRDDVVQRILIEEQVPLRSDDPDSYDPFITVRGKKAWPDHPLYDQLQDVPNLKHHNLEDFYTEWRGEPAAPLERGNDFDDVVLAMPVESLRTYCAEIIEEQSSWRDMVEHIVGVDSRSLRLYFAPKLSDLGWTNGDVVLTGYSRPFSTWEDTSHLAEVETWPPGEQPGSVASLFGALAGPRHAPGPDDPGDYPEHQNRVSRASGLEFLERCVGPLWPRATSQTNPGVVDWSLLVDLENRVGRKRFDFQSVRANYGPIERFTAAQPGTLRYRLRADESGYRNLYLAGDWTRNGAIIGCVEGAVGGGMLAAIAICGEGHVFGIRDDGLS